MPEYSEGVWLGAGELVACSQAVGSRAVSAAGGVRGLAATLFALSGTGVAGWQLVDDAPVTTACVVAAHVISLAPRCTVAGPVPPPRVAVPALSNC